MQIQAFLFRKSIKLKQDETCAVSFLAISLKQNLACRIESGKGLSALIRIELSSVFGKGQFLDVLLDKSGITDFQMLNGDYFSSYSALRLSGDAEISIYLTVGQVD